MAKPLLSEQHFVVMMPMQHSLLNIVHGSFTADQFTITSKLSSVRCEHFQQLREAGQAEKNDVDVACHILGVSVCQ